MSKPISPKQQAFLDRVVEELESEPVSTASPDQLARALQAPPQAVKAMVRLGLESGALKSIGPDLLYTSKQLESIRQVLEGLPAPFSSGQARDALGSSRRYVEPLLEYFDAEGVTQRVPGGRTLG